ncbi:MAG: hypothetical protein KatS3mg021_0348 [Fimbriimonadales bacterium]|nr:MAG: hypothetical protein KatS3mg021_0348 [Fimbriimonadales bacterium]
MRVVLLLIAWIGVMMVLAQEPESSGHTLTIKVVNEQNQPVPNAAVSVYEPFPGGGRMRIFKEEWQRTNAEKRSRNSALQFDAPATAHTQSQSNPPPPHITGHNNDPTDDTPTTTQNYAPPTTDAAAPETLPPNAPHSLNPPPTCSTTTPATPPDPTHCPLSPLAPPDTAPTPHLTPDTLPVRPTHPLPKPIPLTHSPASRLRYGAYAP